MFGLEKIHLIPAAIPPHKQREEICPPEHRLEMVRLAVEGNRCFAVSDMELKREGPSYTIDTVHIFMSGLGLEADNFLLMGLDAFFDIKTWRRYKDLLATLPFIVMGRPLPAVETHGDTMHRMAAYLKEITGNDYALDATGRHLIHMEAPPVFYAEVTRFDISSTRIRCLIQAGEPIDYLVPEPVRRYIIEKGLYQ